MHIPDGLLDTPICLATGSVSLVAVGYSIHRLKDSLADRTVPLTGMVAALVFAGQMVNFPVAAGTSGHLVGGVLAARLLGPWAGCLALTLVLFVQKFLFNDGGLLALGPNILHMAVIGSLGGYAIQTTISRLGGDTIRARVIGVVVASWLTVMLAAVLCSIEFAISHFDTPDFQPGRFLAMMMLFHAFIGVGESLISGGIVRFVSIRRPDLLHTTTPTAATGWRKNVILGLAAALCVAIALAPLASTAPDGLESAIERSQLVTEDPGSASFFQGYDAVLSGDGWESWSVIASGVLGTFVVFVIALVLGRPLGQTTTPDTGTTGD